MTLLEVAKHALEAMEDAMYRADTHEFYDAKESLRYAIEQADQSEQEPVAWSGYDLDAMVEAFGRVIEAHHANNHPFHNPIDSDARMALRILRGFIPAMKAYTAPTPRRPLTDEEMPTLFVGGLALNSEATTEIVRAIEKAHGIGEQT